MNNHLNDTQIHQLQELLESRYRSLWAEIGAELKDSDQEHFLKLAGEVHDMEDESIAVFLTDLNTTMVDRHVQETRDINSALNRIHGGTFGVCKECGGSIGYERLLAYPTANRCVRCQNVYEKTHAGNRSVKL